MLGSEGHKRKVCHALDVWKSRTYLLCLYVDNFYNSVKLVQLLSEETYITGTLRTDLKSNTKEVTTKTLKEGETYTKYKDGEINNMFCIS